MVANSRDGDKINSFIRKLISIPCIEGEKYINYVCRGNSSLTVTPCLIVWPRYNMCNKLINRRIAIHPTLYTAAYVNYNFFCLRLDFLVYLLNIFFRLLKTVLSSLSPLHHTHFFFCLLFRLWRRKISFNTFTLFE